MLKKGLTVFLVLVVVLAALLLTGIVSFAATSEDWGYYTDYDGTVVISYHGKAAEVVVPSEIDGKIVSGIGPWAFEGHASLTSVTIPDGITRIYGNAFKGCTSLTSITIPDSVTWIDSWVFNDTAYYNNDENWKDGVLYIGNHLIKAKFALSGDYVIKDGTKSIAGHAFCCPKLTSISMPNSVKGIAQGAFEGCDALASITIPDGVTKIRDGTFYQCESLASITIPNGVTSIGDGAFCGCESLTSITIPNSVTWIGEEAFCGCVSLASITIPDGVTSIGLLAFHATAYADNAANWENDVLYIGNHLIKAKDTLSGKYSIKANTKTIADSAFYSCKSLTGVTIPNSITRIGQATFDECTALKSVKIPNSVTSIDEYAFRGCTSLTNIVIPRSVTSIGEASFSTYNMELDKLSYVDTISGYTGSYAETYAKAKSIPFIPLDKSCFVKVNGKYYYYVNGVMRTGWQKLKRGDGNTYLHYFGTDGVMSTGWRKIKRGDGKTYLHYFGTNGCMRTGWQKIQRGDGKTYLHYFGTNGCMRTGWQSIKRGDGKTYKHYFGTNGCMRTGWQTIKNSKGVAYKYYFRTNGTMVTGNYKIGSKTYKFNKYGVCQNP